MIQGHQTWLFESRPVIRATGTVGGPFEAQGAIAGDFDILHGDIWLGETSLIASISINASFGSLAT